MSNEEMIYKTVDGTDTSASGIVVQKFDGEVGEIEAYISSFNNIDREGDVMLPEAFDKTVEEWEGKQLPMYLQHNKNVPIGSWSEFEINSRGVKAKGQIFTETSLGADARNMVLRGLIGSTSIGFRTKPAWWYDRTDKEGNRVGREFKRVELVETSLVVAPANQKAKITSVKDEDGRLNIRKLEDALRDVGMTQKERKVVLSAAATELRDVLQKEDAKAKLIAKLNSDK